MKEMGAEMYSFYIDGEFWTNKYIMPDQTPVDFAKWLSEYEKIDIRRISFIVE